MKIYLVGGAVRDRILQRDPGDRDWVVVGASQAQMEALGYKAVGRDFPVFLHPDTGEEYALARTERKSGRGYRGFVVDADPSVTLEDDLLRRDFTINAIACDEATGALVDPYGGLRDIEQRVLRHVGPAFVEDPLRVLRAARFMARFAPLGFTVAPETMDLMRQIADSGELDALVPERVWQELRRALTCAQPSAFLRTLHDAGALRAILPAGTLSGAPKVRAMQIIDELEPVKRGVYGGAVGYLAWNGNMDTAIAIRTAVIKDGELHVQAGAGIVADSQPALEWEETLNKRRAMFRAVALAERDQQEN